MERSSARSALCIVAIVAAGLTMASCSRRSPPDQRTSASLPDTATWAPFACPEGKLAAKTPPGATVTCKDLGLGHGMTGVLVVGRRGRPLGQLLPAGSDARAIGARLQANPIGNPRVIYENGNDLVIHREHPKLGAFCEFVAEAPSKMVALQAAPEESGDSAFFKSSLALTDTECLEAVAFTHTLVTTP